MAIEVAMEDDLFFADLNRQISLLIDEDDDVPLYHFPPVFPQEFSQSIIHPPIMPSNHLYQEFSRREISKGTGVFIPQSSQPIRRRPYKRQSKRAATNYSAKSNNHHLNTTPNSRGRSIN